MGRSVKGVGVGFVRVASIAEVPEGELRAYELPPGRVAVAHIENELFAFGDECTHEGCWLSEGSLDETADTIVCACHGSAFDVRSGEPAEGPAEDPLTLYPVRVRDDWIEILPRSGGEA